MIAKRGSALTSVHVMWIDVHKCSELYTQTRLCFILFVLFLKLFCLVNQNRTNGEEGWSTAN